MNILSLSDLELLEDFPEGRFYIPCYGCRDEDVSKMVSEFISIEPVVADHIIGYYVIFRNLDDALQWKLLYA